MERINQIAKGMVVVMIVAFCSCTKYNYIDGGIANGVHDCTMWEYFHTDSYNWDSTIIMIEHAGLKSLFDGTGEYEQITFFGLTNLSILRYMMINNDGLEETDPHYMHRVTDIPKGKCQDILQKLVVSQRLMLNDIPRGSRLLQKQQYVETGGVEYDCVKGKVFLWTLRGTYNNVQDAGEVQFYLASHNMDNIRNEQIVSTDIQTTNGVVQALNYDFRFTNF